jgi:subtilisin family serine protease
MGLSIERREYLILRVPPAGSPGGSFAFSSGTAPAAALIDVAHLTDEEASALRRERDAFVSEPMPVTLVAPAPGTDGNVWGLDAVGATSTPFTGAGVTVAVLDTGVDATHPAFAGVTVVAQDFTGTGEVDTDGHGTHCAATILGRDVDGTRIGVAPGVSTLLAGKVIGGNSTTIDVTRAVTWALEHGANVISMSLGIDFVGYAEKLREQGLPGPAATSRALAAYRNTVGIFEVLAQQVRAQASFGSPAILVAAAGNASQRAAPKPYTIEVEPPAAVEEFVSVAALDRDLSVAKFSNTGARVSAPGVDIMSARLGGGLVSLSGTSMATPHVAGVAALWYEKLAASGRVDPRTLTSRLIGNARPVDGLAGADGGAGVVTAPAL